MIVKHVALENKWNTSENLQNAQKLILGSFNPYNINGNNTDYFYGRRTNYFWKALAELNNLNPNIFYNNLDLKLEYMNRFRFCFMDIIDSIQIECQCNNELILNKFINQKIHTEFSDRVIFTTRTSFEKNTINVKRTYNHSIINLLQTGRIQKVIHTMGNNTIGIDFKTKWQENRLGANGFQGFINNIRMQKNINFISQSYSPSGYAVNKGGPNYFNNLKNWLQNNILDK